jgi:hypothetical protein
MASDDELFGWIAIIVFLSLLAIGIHLMHLLPGEVRPVLMVWVGTSFHISVLIGHCVLSEERGGEFVPDSLVM